jgi:hypothetical protein
VRDVGDELPAQSVGPLELLHLPLDTSAELLERAFETVDLVSRRRYRTRRAPSLAIQSRFSERAYSSIEPLQASCQPAKQQKGAGQRDQDVSDRGYGAQAQNVAVAHQLGDRFVLFTVEHDIEKALRRTVAWNRRHREHLPALQIPRIVTAKRQPLSIAQERFDRLEGHRLSFHLSLCR